MTVDLPPPPAEVAEVENPAAASLAAHVRATCDVVSVTVTRLDLGQDVADSAEITWIGEPCLPYPRLRAELGDGTTVPVRAHLDLRVQGPTAPSSVAPGDIFEPVPGVIRWEDAKMPLRGRVKARLPIRQGDAVTARVASRMPDVQAGDPVEIVLQKGVVRVTAPGRLGRAGFVGERVQVRNLSTRAVHEGVLVDARTVVLAP